MSVKRWMYQILYRIGAPWEGGVRENLVQLLEHEQRLSPDRQKTVLDMGCGSGTCSVYLAGHGFEVTGVDFTPVALRKAQRAAQEAGVTDRCRFVRADLRSPRIPGVEGTYDLIVDFGTLDDLTGQDRLDMAANITRHSHPGTLVVLWCFYSKGDRSLPLFRYSGVSRALSGLRPGEEQELFGADFEIERLPEPPVDSTMACFLMTRR
ncbi:class I SAM-dependent methyltransferase [Streptomyces sp. JJ36]|uniref:class I SAM-dependent methyltransferase n=1 Tax=Streptomyces sp. JJ36 TaxID=2736645 RepID=UPI001F32122B|nr:class I SAM-dependent methyltransferase [Streptomyces sp. JJ36]MCF6522524.1 class I SAM-dependent methyltransferase [Streptomyces sp. JJ36]